MEYLPPESGDKPPKPRGSRLPTPPWAHEPVVIAEADPAWAALAAVEAAAVSAALAPWLTGGVRHVGSTSVLGLCAKPVLDLLAGVTHPGECTDAPLAAAGWHHVPVEVDGQAWRRFYVKARDERRHAHLHVVVTGGPQWGAVLAFRDHLRADPGLRDAYAAHKRDLAARLGADREAYTLAKTDFILAALGTGR